MRILYCTDTFLPEINGVTTVLATMRDGLRQRGHEVMLAAPSYGAPAADESGIRRLAAVPCPGYPQVRLSWPWGRGLPREFDRFAPDLVHLVTEGPIGAFGRSLRPAPPSPHRLFLSYRLSALRRPLPRPPRCRADPGVAAPLSPGRPGDADTQRSDPGGTPRDGD